MQSHWCSRATFIHLLLPLLSDDVKLHISFISYSAITTIYYTYDELAKLQHQVCILYFGLPEC